nr:dTDP-4-dehydrorhamnose reductase [Cellulomonas humilata]
MVVGASGMLGQEMVALLGARGEDVVGTTRTDLDVTDPVAVGTVVDGVGRYDIVVNCTAYAAVDAAETDEPAAFAVNAVAASYLARASARSGARLVHISTDYVFDGHAGEPYAEDAPAAPRSAYGRTKVAGEWAVRAECPDHLLVRTAWLYGAHGACFPKTIARAARERSSLDVVADQLGQPTWTADLADLVHRLVQAGVPAGTYHGTSSGSTSWHGFAAAVVGAAGMDPAIVHPTTSEAFVRPAPRPAYSVLGHDALRDAGIEPIGPWEDRWAAAAESVLA